MSVVACRVPRICPKVSVSARASPPTRMPAAAMKPAVPKAPSLPSQFMILPPSRIGDGLVAFCRDDMRGREQTVEDMGLAGDDRRALAGDVAAADLDDVRLGL